MSEVPRSLSDTLTIPALGKRAAEVLQVIERQGYRGTSSFDLAGDLCFPTIPTKQWELLHNCFENQCSLEYLVLLFATIFEARDEL
ncbi:hypothetical protein VP1G_10616 [Cytospora mali]|uniref:Uncharacterized protein n=1 Tax=Cytospora mali TaxID=578113 RepID=A0A194UR41_CYTMA|nr:hypothetical protein VP1G_10616 [Valsa mali var. pyri (nom. inval.)]